MNRLALTPKVRVGISSCLLGEAVRYDGGHKHNPLITGLLGQYFDWVPVCPEAESGLGIPRETLRLVGSPDNPRMVTAESDIDHTESMRLFADGRLRQLAQMGLRGFILKKDSPSCGLFRVRIYGGNRMPQRTGRGLFAGALARRFRMLPLEEEGRLNDAVLRENFIERVFGYHRWLDFIAAGPKPKNLAEFHANHKLTLLSHSRPHLSHLGRLVADGAAISVRDLLSRYGEIFMEALACKATRRKHSDVLYHLASHLKRDLDREDKSELIACIEDYRKGVVPLIVPLTLLKHHFRRFPKKWVSGQTYLNPYPAELMLRNHV